MTGHRPMTRTLLWLAVTAVVVTAVTAEPSAAQQTMPAEALPGQSLRAYWHVFIAYALVIVLLGGYVISIGRRLGDVERRLDD